MKRHPALVPLSHDHHHALVEARRLRRAAGGDASEAAAAAEAFVRFFRDVSVTHFREEEESLFPLVAGEAEAEPLVVRALLDHQRLHALVGRLEEGGDPRPAMTEAGELLEAHVRLEERELFPLLERLAADRLSEGERSGAAERKRRGPVWGLASDDLNATLLEWPAGDGPPEHVNDERDVFVVVLDGAARVSVGEEERELRPAEGLVIEKGKRRKITAGDDGVRYVAVHLRRAGLQIGSAPDRA